MPFYPDCDPPVYEADIDRQPSLSVITSSQLPSQKRSVMTNFSQTAAYIIWSLADLLRDLKQSQYGRVILPITQAKMKTKNTWIKYRKDISTELRYVAVKVERRR